jgi:hypothetical protein
MHFYRPEHVDERDTQHFTRKVNKDALFEDAQTILLPARAEEKYIFIGERRNELWL